MFFNRIGSVTHATISMSSTTNCPREVSLHRPASPQRRRKAALALAVAMTVPMLWFDPVPAPAQQIQEVALPADLFAQADVVAIPAADQELSDADKLAQGIRLHQADQYEEALALLRAVDPNNLTDAEKKRLNDTLSSAEQAARQRQEARAQFELGEQALEAGNAQQAIEHYRNAARNRFADNATRQKANEKIAVAQTQIGTERSNLQATYNSAVEDFKAGRFEEARAKFQQLRDANYRAPLFKRSPQDYLKDIDRRVAQAQPAETPVEQPAEVVVQPEAGTQVPGEAVVQTEQGTDVVVAQPQATAEGEVVDAGGAPELTRQERAAIAKQAYNDGKAAYRAGDLETARANFARAQEYGYRAGLFEDSPAKYISRIDARLAAQAEAVAQAQAQTQASAQATVTTPTAPPSDTLAIRPDPNAERALETTAQLERVRQQEAALQAQALVEQARRAEAGRDYQRALELYTQALELQPGNEAAAQGRAQMLALVTGTPTSPLDQREREILIAIDEFNVRFGTHIDAATESAQRGDYVTAQQEIDRARVALDSARTLLPPDRAREAAQIIANSQAGLDRMRAQAAADEAEARRREALEQQQQQQRLAAQQREQTIRELITDAKRLIDRRDYRQAASVLQQVLQLDPYNEYASSVLPLVQDQVIIQTQSRYRDQFLDQFELQLNQSQEKLIPYDDIFRYPDNWPELSRSRDRLVAEEQALSPEDVATQALLDRKLPEVRFDRVSLEDAIEFLRDLTGANIYVNWGALQASMIDKSTPVTARLRDVRLSKALQVILQDAGSVPVPRVSLDYAVEDGVITISTTEDLEQNAVYIPRTYDLNDLLLTPRAVDRPDTQILGGSNTSGSSRSGGGFSGGGGGFGGFGGNNGGGLFGEDDDDDEDIEEQRAEDVQAIIDLLMASVPENSWQVNNIDARGTITERPRSGVLVVVQTPKNHATINEILTQLRQARGVQIAIEARFLTVSRNYLEDVGIDLDFQFNDVGSNFPGGIGVDQDTSDFTRAPQTPVPGTLGGLVGNPSLQITGTFLDDFQADFLIRATQAQVNSATVNAPRVTLYNGQEAVLVVVRRQYYVADLEPVVGSVGLFNPTIEPLDTGIIFYVRAAVSPDRKYVDMDLRPVLTSFNSFTTFQFQTAAEGGDGDDGVAGVPGAQVQLPDLTITTVQTYVTVPDGGTLLLGGQTLAGEVEREKGVPGLSKVPFIKRLFTNRSMAKDDQILLILVKPTIIITREREEQSFPLLSTQVTN